MGVSPSAMLSVVWQTTFRSLSAPCHWMQSMRPSNGGMESLLHEQRHSVPHGPLLPTSNNNWSGSCESGISSLQVLSYKVPCHTPSFKMVFIKHAAVLDQLCNHKQAIVDRSTTQPATCCCKNWAPFKTAALNPSDPHWVLAGSLYSTHSYQRSWRSLPKAPCLTRYFLPKRNTKTSSNLGFTAGEMAYRPCPTQRFPISANISGQSIPNTSLVTSPNHPSTRFKKPSRALSSIVKTNKPPHWEYTARAYTTKPSNKPFRIPPFSNRSPKILNPSSHLLSLFYIDNMEKPTLGR